jgi:hypothetical protein
LAQKLTGGKCLVKLATQGVSMPNQETDGKTAAWKIWVTVFVIIGFIAPFLYFTPVVYTDPKSQAITWAVLLAGGALGWVIGIFISPMPDEKDQFQTYAKAIAAGISGYALAKIDPVISKLLEGTSALQPEAAFRFLGFLVTFIVSMLASFGWRRYLSIKR